MNIAADMHPIAAPRPQGLAATRRGRAVAERGSASTGHPDDVTAVPAGVVAPYGQMSRQEHFGSSQPVSLSRVTRHFETFLATDTPQGVDVKYGGSNG